MRVADDEERRLLITESVCFRFIVDAERLSTGCKRKKVSYWLLFVREKNSQGMSLQTYIYLRGSLNLNNTAHQLGMH